MTTTTIKIGYVLTDKGEVLVQRPAENQFGFELCSDDQSWPGGIGVAKTWTALADNDPRITDEVRAAVGWIADAEVREYVWVADGFSWGTPAPDADDQARLCKIAEEWLTDHEGDGLSIRVRLASSGEIAGLYEVRENGNLQILGHTVPKPADVEDLTNRAWEYALQHADDVAAETVTVSRAAIERGRCDADGKATQDARDAAAWRTCLHDTGNGSCAACDDAGTTEWAHPCTDGLGHDADCQHVTADDALACYLESRRSR